MYFTRIEYFLKAKLSKLKLELIFPMKVRFHILEVSQIVQANLYTSVRQFPENQ